VQRTLPVLIGQLSSTCSTTQEVCSQVLLQLSTRKEDKIKLVHAGALPGLFRLVQNGSVDCQELVIATLRNLASNAESRVEIGGLGGIEVLIQAIADERPTRRAKENACAALVNLAMNSEANKRRIVDGGGLQVLLQMLAGVEAGGGQEQAIAALRNIASVTDNKEVIANAGTIRVCLTLIESSGTDLAKEHAAATLANLASGCIPNKQRIANEGGIPVLVQLVSSRWCNRCESSPLILFHTVLSWLQARNGAREGAKEYASAALGSVAASPTLKSVVYNAGAVEVA
jgi:hypothetical protein